MSNWLLRLASGITDWRQGGCSTFHTSLHRFHVHRIERPPIHPSTTFTLLPRTDATLPNGTTIYALSLPHEQPTHLNVVLHTTHSHTHTNIFEDELAHIQTSTHLFVSIVTNIHAHSRCRLVAVLYFIFFTHIYSLPTLQQCSFLQVQLGLVIMDSE